MSTGYRISDQTGRRFLVTGANSGLGKETTRRLADAGACVVMACRSLEKAEAAREEILQEVPEADLDVKHLDLGELASVHALAEEVRREGKGLDVLVNNAGVMMPPERLLTQDGVELQWGSNFLGHFALTNLLLPTLLESAAPRVATMSSSAARMTTRPTTIRFGDLNAEKKYSPGEAYGQSKLGNLLMGLHLAQASQERGWALVSTMAHPGYTRTNLQSAGASMGSGKATLGSRVSSLGVLPSMDVAQGVESELMAATDARARNGAFFGPTGRFGLVGPAAEVPVYPNAMGPTLAASVWAVGVAQTGTDLPRR